jgi:tetratricopeptide (TPR) repeat protein
MRGELDWIVMKCLEKDRTRRYETASGLAADVRRYLDDEPVQACPPSAWYRFGKFARRNRAALTTAALVGLALVAGTTVSVWQAVRAAQAAGEARQRAEESRRVVDYLANDIFGAATPGQRGSRSVTVGELLDRADATLGERFRGQPLVEASIRMALAWSNHHIGRLDRCVQNAARAAQIREHSFGPEHPETLEALNLQAWVTRNSNWDDREKIHTAESIARRVLAARRRVLGLTHADTIKTQADLGLNLGLLGRLDEAETLLVEAVALGTRALGAEHESTIEARHFLGMVCRMQGELARAEALLRQVLDSSERIYGKLDISTLHTLKDLAYAVRDQGRIETARQLMMETVNRFAQTYGLCHIQTSSTIGALVSLLKEQRDYAAIRDLCEGWLREILAWPPELDPYGRSRRSIRLSGLALTLATLPEPIPFDGELAVRAAEQAAEQGNDTQDNNWTRLCLVHLRLGHTERAEWAVRESMKRRKGGDCFDSMAQALIHARRGESAEARAWFDRAAREAGRDNGPPGSGYEQVRDEVAVLLGVNDLPADVFARP